MKWLLLCSFFLCSCTLIRTTVETEQTKKVNTVTETTEISDVIHGDKIVQLEKVTWSRTVSDEIANLKISQSTSTDLGSSLLNFGSGLTGMGPIAETAITLGLAYLGGKKVLKKRIPAPMPQPQTQPVRPTRSKMTTLDEGAHG